LFPYDVSFLKRFGKLGGPYNFYAEDPGVGKRDETNYDANNTLEPGEVNELSVLQPWH
jgi:hypothetical protein